MDYLFSPWRMSYLNGEEKRPTVDCIFCAKAQGDDAAEHIVYRSKYVYVALNLYPYNNGHLMVIPYAHVATFEHMPLDVMADLMLTASHAVTALRTVYKPGGFNVGANLGEASGAGIAGHFHLHVVPRWPGDTNFMTVVGSARVIPESLEDTWRRLRNAWPQAPE